MKAKKIMDPDQRDKKQEKKRAFNAFVAEYLRLHEENYQLREKYQNNQKKMKDIKNANPKIANAIGEIFRLGAIDSSDEDEAQPQLEDREQEGGEAGPSSNLRNKKRMRRSGEK